jgi:hypothetical protein
VAPEERLEGARPTGQARDCALQDFHRLGVGAYRTEIEPCRIGRPRDAFSYDVRRIAQS